MRLKLVCAVLTALFLTVVYAQGPRSPSIGPDTLVLIYLNGYSQWADLGPGMIVDVTSGGRPVIRSVMASTAPQIVLSEKPTVIFDGTKTCGVLLRAAKQISLTQNGVTQIPIQDYTFVPDSAQFCFTPFWGNLTANPVANILVSYTY